MHNQNISCEKQIEEAYDDQSCMFFVLSLNTGIWWYVNVIIECLEHASYNGLILKNGGLDAFNQLQSKISMDTSKAEDNWHKLGIDVYIIVQESTILETKHALITCSIVTAESLGQLKIRFRSGSKSSLTANIP
jgi:hypothetical protein